jgi:uncharacterized protein (DUF362 family)
MISSQVVGIASIEKPWIYPASLPFLPGVAYPEFRGLLAIGEENSAFTCLRELMRELQMDPDHFSTPDWNPLGDIISPGQKVLVKPNVVQHLHGSGGEYKAVVTHGSLVRCILDYVALALMGKGEIVVGDAPVQSADFSQIIERTGLRQVCDDVSKRWNVPVRVVDFRLRCAETDYRHRIIRQSALEGDLIGYCAVDLGKRSLLARLAGHSGKFRVTNYDCGEMREHHNAERNEYLIPKSVLESDVVINLPKLKTHRKVGLTAGLKNVVGINGHKDWLPHHRCGSVAEGGDEYQNPSFLKRFQTYLIETIDKNPDKGGNSIRRLGIRIARRLALHLAADRYTEGSWYGNDTLWRTVLDLNRLLIYADKEGEMRDTPQRQCLTVVDAIWAGEGEGPVEPDARPLGVLVGGINPVAVDAVLATMIGFDYRKIPLIARAFLLEFWTLVDFGPERIEIRTQSDRYKSVKVGKPFRELIFKPPSGWAGQIES